MTAAQFNARYPVGTLVRYFPAKDQERGEPTQTTSVAWQRGPEAIVAVVGFREGVAIERLEVDL